jgi:hypothetical protein
MSAGTGHTSFEQRLKAQIDRYPVRVRPGLAREAYQAHRRHRVVRRSVAAAGAAVVIAAAVTLAVTGTAPFSAAPGGQRPGPTSSLPAGGGIPPVGLQPTPPGDDLTPSQAAHDIMWDRTTTEAIPARDAEITDAFRYGYKAREITYYPDGKPQLDYQFSRVKGKGGGIESVETNVRYQNRTWNRVAFLLSSVPSPVAPAGAQDPCQVVQTSGLDGMLFLTAPDPARSLIACPGLRVTRGVALDGINAIKITNRYGATLWVNAATYVPIELELVYTGKPLPLGYNGAKLVGQVIQFGYLPPTAANLAYLSAPIPAGFKGSTRDLQSRLAIPRGKIVPVAPWTPPAGVIPPYGVPLAPPGDGLTATRAAADILHVRTTTTAIPASDTVEDDSFWYRSASRDLTYYPDGKPWDDSQVATIRGAGGKVTTYDTVVNYDNRSWSRQAAGGGTTTVAPAQTACATAQSTGLASISFQATPDAARSLLSCQGQVVTRGLTLDGAGAIKIAGKESEVLWVNATTYLPIEIVITYGKGDMPPAGYHNAKSPEQVYQYAWLPPTPANLAYLGIYLGIPVPSGFAAG